MIYRIYDTAIVGAGASGLMAACFACEGGLKTVLIDKNHKVGRKILSTGAGKCNLSNENISVDDYLCAEKDRLRELLSIVKKDDILNFFSEDLGMMLLRENDGKIYPFSKKSETPIFAFEKYLKKHSVEIFTLLKVSSIINKNDLFEIELNQCLAPGEKETKLQKTFTILARKVILACGGPSYPRIGGSQDGFALAKSFGHSIRNIKPILTPFNVKMPNLSLLDGLRLTASAFYKQKKIEGEILFSSSTISGPLALDLSFFCAGEYIDEISIDLIPEIEKEKIINFFKNKHGSYFDVLSASLDKKLSKFILDLTGINPQSEKKDEGIHKVVEKLKNLKFKGLSPCGFDAAMAKTGGVPLSELDNNFMSLKKKNLFLTGEMIDCGGRSGGYNLHFAWISGILAGKKAAKT